MTLAKRTVTMPFVGGVSSKDDPKQVTLGKLLALSNGVFTSPGQIKKANGYAALPTAIEGGGNIANGVACFTRGSELCFVDNTSTLYSYDQSRTNWVKKGFMPSVTASVAPLASTQYTMRNLDLAVAANGLQCLVYDLIDQNATSSTYKGVGYSIIDGTTGQIVVAPTTIAAVATSITPRVVYVGTKFLICWVQTDFSTTAAIMGTTVDSAAPLTAPPAAVALTSGSTTSALAINVVSQFVGFDMCSNNGAAYLHFVSRSGGSTAFRCLAATPTTVTNTATSVVAGSSIAPVGVFPDPGSNNQIVFLGAANANGVFAVLSSDLSVTVKASTNFATAGSGTLQAITGVATSAGVLQLFSGGNGSGIYTVTISGASYGTQTGSAYVYAAPPIYLGGKAASIGGVAYVPAWFATDIGATGFTPQSTVFLFGVNSVRGKALVGTAGATATVGAASSIGPLAGAPYGLGSSYVVGGAVTLPSTYSLRISSLQNNPYAPGTLVSYQFAAAAVTFNTVDTANGYIRTESAHAVHTSGSVPYMYDGQSVAEHGFNIYPYNVTLSGSNAAGSILAGVYQYVVTYEWTDAAGQTHRSAPSVPVSITVPGNPYEVTVTIPPLFLTAKTGVLVQVWRTLANGSTFFQITNFNTNGALYNNTGLSLLTWLDTLNDSSIKGNPQLYTTGNVLANDALSGAASMVLHRNRVFAVDPANPTQVQFSKLLVAPAPVEFSAFQFFNTTGPEAVTALGSMDEKLILFRKNRISVVYGNGPDSTGGQNDFIEIPIPSDTGCAIPKSVVAVPDGLMFQSPKGIYLLDRALQFHYIGAEQEANLGTVVGAALMPSVNQVRFAQTSATAGELVYDTHARQWAQNARSNADSPVDVCVWNGTHVELLASAGTPTQETAGAFTAEGNARLVSLTTPWIQLSNLQGFQRIWRILILGTYKSPHTLTVKVFYDFSPTASQTDNIVISGSVVPLQYVIRPVRQRCQAIQLQITDGATSGTGESLALSALTIEYGAQPGVYRLPKAQSYG